VKLALTADLHFDLRLRYSKPDANTGLTTRLADHVECWRWIVDTAVEQGCDQLVVLGDVFESRTEIDVAVIDTVCREFHSASERIPLTVLAGNHDCRLRTADVTSTSALLGAASVVREFCMEEDVAYIPWNDNPEVIHEHIKGAVGAGARFVLGHWLVQGIFPGESGVPQEYMAAHHFARIILGDVHKKMKVGKNIWYCGSPMHLDYREAGNVPGFYVLDTKASTDGTFAFIENKKSPRFHLLTDDAPKPEGTLDKRDFVRVQIEDADAARETTEWVQRITEQVETNSVEVGDTTPRIEMKASDGYEEILRRYCQFVGLEEDRVEAYVQEGMEILAEAGT
jgi:DNA repair exonuclease SbcCD nuclease subunit